MSKPWDHLLVKPRRATLIGCGAFQSPGASRVHITNHEHLHKRHVGLIFGSKECPGVCFWNPGGLRDLAEFADTLADQIDAGYHPRDITP